MITGLSAFSCEGYLAPWAAVCTFLRCYFFTIIPAPYFRKHGKLPGIAAFINGVTAAAIGAIPGAVIFLGRKTLVVTEWRAEAFKIVLFPTAVALLWRIKKRPVPLLVVAAAALGLAFQASLAGVHSNDRSNSTGRKPKRHRSCRLVGEKTPLKGSWAPPGE